MTHWNYRVVKAKDKLGNDYYAVREVYYNDKNQPTMRTEAATDVMGETEEEARNSYLMMAEAFTKPVLTDEEIDLTYEDQQD